MNLFRLRFNSYISQIVLRAPTRHKSLEEKHICCSFRWIFAKPLTYFQLRSLCSAADTVFRWVTNHQKDEADLLPHLINNVSYAFNKCSVNDLE